MSYTIDCLFNRVLWMEDRVALFLCLISIFVGCVNEVKVPIYINKVDWTHSSVQLARKFCTFTCGNNNLHNKRYMILRWKIPVIKEVKLDTFSFAVRVHCFSTFLPADERRGQSTKDSIWNIECIKIRCKVCRTIVTFFVADIFLSFSLHAFIRFTTKGSWC